MKNLDEFSSIEQAAMEQSPAHETNVHYNFMKLSSFLDDIAEGVGGIVENVGDHVVAGVEDAVNDVAEIGENVAAVAEGAADLVDAVAGGVIIDRVFTKKQTALLKSVNLECSVDELIDLRSSLMKVKSIRE
ncbi:hypothetical protein [uncultured Dokdonia sp.]|uniref:hypothetical protein n=1 Tax=uncultured Dokdonia sp. TaxID=575653 RepID=UPI00261F9804|nr:hypothetical protein [uncultured Dokdonia sp.]